ncbi:MAG: DUF6290 family protein [Parachlamydiaceae bacterium]
MEKQQYKKLSVEFPAEEYVYLKMACAKKGVSLKEFVSQAVIRSIEEYEDELDLKALEQISHEDRKSAQPWEDVKRELGWDKL